MIRLSVFMALLFVASAGSAHEPSLAFLRLTVDGDRIVGRWDVALRDVEEAVGLDVDGDRQITWAEFQSRRGALLDDAAAHLSMDSGGRSCDLEVANGSLDRHAGTTYAVLELDALCPGPVSELAVDYRWLFDVDAGHRALLDVESGALSATAVLSLRQPGFRFDGERASAWDGFSRLVVEGVLHIWHGYDHLLFLAVLLLPVLLSSAAGTTLAAKLAGVARIVTVFTLAHSVTLGLAASGLIDLPSAVVEAVIAASIVAAAVTNVVAPKVSIGLSLAFGFGLIHGLGFASALSGLGSGRGLVGLLGFNLGVELGQLAVVAVTLPVLFALSRQPRLAQPLLATASMGCAAVGLVWFIGRLSV